MFIPLNINELETLVSAAKSFENERKDDLGETEELNALGAVLDKLERPAESTLSGPAEQLLAMLGALIEWDAYMGYHDSPVWDRARDLYERTR